VDEKVPFGVMMKMVPEAEPELEEEVTISPEPEIVGDVEESE
jgi:hypothetical protein